MGRQRLLETESGRQGGHRHYLGDDEPGPPPPRLLGIAFEDDEDYDTLGGYLIGRLGRIPDEEEKPEISVSGWLFQVESIEENLFDIAGVRVICSFPDDIYTTAALLAKQDDVRVLTEKDYIKNPKPNGYRSLHLIVEVPIFLSEEKKYMKVEVQFRTIAMDFWASLEHKLKYKKDLDDQAAILAELKACADGIATLDLRMQSIRDRIGENKE